MAYPKEKENIAYLDYVQRISLGEEQGPKLSKEEWRKRRVQNETEDDDEDESPDSVLKNAY